MPIFKAWINPLKCPEIDFSAPGSPTPAVERLFDYLSAPELDRSPEAFVSRYRELSDSLFAAPAESNLLAKLVWPLRHAKGSYALGNYLGCIALCGMVGEMVAILLWDIAKIPLDGHPMTEAQQRALFGSTVERLGQERRVQVLHTMKLMDDKAKDAFDQLREIRRKYLHFFSHSHEQIAADARKAFECAMSAVLIVLGQTVTNGSMALRADLMAYLTEHGLVSPSENGGA